MRRPWGLALLLLAACSKGDGDIPTVVKGNRFDEASLVEKGKVTILDFSADW
jgi:hypothetical protein